MLYSEVKQNTRLLADRCATTSIKRKNQPSYDSIQYTPLFATLISLQNLSTVSSPVFKATSNTPLSFFKNTNTHLHVLAAKIDGKPGHPPTNTPKAKRNSVLERKNLEDRSSLCYPKSSAEPKTFEHLIIGSRN